MALSPAQRHMVYVQAKEAARQGGALSRHANGYEMMLLKIEEDSRRLKRVQSQEKKAEVKREILPHYSPWVAGVLQTGMGAQDDVIMHVMVWRIDAGDHNGAIDIAEYALKHGLVMPSRYARQTACAVAEEIADSALKAYDAKQPVNLSILTRLMDLIEDHDMPDEVRAKLHKVMGYGLRDSEQPELALNQLNRAFQLHERVGVKKDIERLERELKKAENG